MQKKLEITVLTIILITILTLTVHISLVNASPVIFNMDTLPENQGWTINKNGNVSSSVSNGILTLENNGGSFRYTAPADWSNTVNNTKGWIVEFRLKLENSSISSQNPLIRISISDHDYGQAIDLSENGITMFLATGFSRHYLMNTTDNFHAYKFIGQENIFRVFVDEKLVFDLNRLGSASGASGAISITSDLAYTISYWDYFSYDTNPNLTLTSPTLTVVDGTSSYYISNLTGVTLDNSPIVIPNGIYAGWCVDKLQTMIRNEAHDISLYSSTQYIPVDFIRLLPQSTRPYNWSSVNYILNHKQGNMQEIQNAIWYFVPDQTSPSLNETNTWSMISSAKANSNYVPGKGEIMAVIAYAGLPISSSPPSISGVQTTILEYRIP